MLHFDFKDNQTALLAGVWQVLGQHEDWLSTAVKTSDPAKLSPIERKPILVITEEADEQQKVFYDDVPVGGRLRLFGSAHTHPAPKNMTKEQLVHWAVTVSPEELVKEKPTNYRRWWNSSWYAVEEGGEPRAGDWTAGRQQAFARSCRPCAPDGLLGAVLRAGRICSGGGPGLGDEL